MCGPYFALGSENTDCASLCCFGFLLLKLWGHVLLVQGSDYYDCAGAYCSQCVGLIVSYHWVLPVKGSCLFLGPAVFYKRPLFLLYLVSIIIQCISLYNTIPIITSPLQVSSMLVLIIIANMDTGIANMDNSHCHSHGHNNRKGVVEVEKVVEPEKGRGERTQKG